MCDAGNPCAAQGSARRARGQDLWWPKGGPPALDAVDRLIELYGIEPVPVDVAQVALARGAMLAYGKGRGEAPAALNFGDLFAYALAKQLRLPLLFKGDDFLATDVVPVP
jgi:ribonuclease VapC